MAAHRGADDRGAGRQQRRRIADRTAGRRRPVRRRRGVRAGPGLDRGGDRRGGRRGDAAADPALGAARGAGDSGRDRAGGAAGLRQRRSGPRPRLRDQLCHRLRRDAGRLRRTADRRSRRRSRARAAPAHRRGADRGRSDRPALGGLLLAVVLLDGPADLIHTDYGRAAAGPRRLAAGRGDRHRRSRLATRRPAVASRTTALAMLGVLAAVSAMAVQAAPRLLNHRFTVWDIFLGYSLPGPPTLVRILTTWRFDTFLGAAGVVAAAAYLAGYLLLRRRGDTWSTGRLVSWLSGCALLVFDTSSGLRAYGSAMFSVHMAEHMLLNMFVPVLLVLGGPVTLALRTLHPAGHGHPPGPREWLLTLVHSRVTTFLSHPVTAFVLFVASLYIVYFTSLFDHLVRYHWGHELMSTHFLITGYLFFWAIIGIDPGPKRLPFLGRLALLFAVMPFHAFFGIALMTMENVIGGTFYRYLALPWVDSLVDDQHLGGSIAWGSSELPVIIVVIALVAQWAGSDRRAARRSDRHADADYGDDDLDAYNAMLAELSKHRQ
ncbi:cytochrome c oxidase assembly protein [Mycolicibacterium insubricum]|nr:cytochrome c oxidase assembly protein [Mycolicibacterium insubricum]